jgi:hypothetical protein
LTEDLLLELKEHKFDRFFEDAEWFLFILFVCIASFFFQHVNILFTNYHCWFFKRFVIKSTWKSNSQ